MSQVITLDVDSSLTTIEGLDFISAQKDQGLANIIKKMTYQAMNLSNPSAGMFTKIYEKRLKLIKPNEGDIRRLSQAYLENLTEGAYGTVRALRENGNYVYLVTGGIAQAIQPLAEHLGVVGYFAVPLRFDFSGNYAGYDLTEPLANFDGKRRAISKLRRIHTNSVFIHIGDGSTDAETIPEYFKPDLDLTKDGWADIFIAYTGVIRREEVVRKANLAVRSMPELLEYIL